jgi:shikimate kinase
MRLSLIGMSGVGKSTYSSALARAGYSRFGCDERIAERLAAVLRRGDLPPMGLGEWMGFPDEKGYDLRERRYLDCEKSVMSDILAYLEDADNDAETDIVIDTTGSVIYTGDAILDRLRRCAIVVHLSTPPEVQAQMLDAYLTHQRPVLWRGLFETQPGESRSDALARCYSRLLTARERLYGKWADVTLSYGQRNRSGFDLIREVKAAVLNGQDNGRS